MSACGTAEERSAPFGATCQTARLRRKAAAEPSRRIMDPAVRERISHIMRAA